MDTVFMVMVAIVGIVLIVGFLGFCWNIGKGVKNVAQGKKK